MEDTAGNVGGLACLDGATFFPEAHLALALDDEINFFLLLVVPRNLSAVGLERDIAHGEVCGLDRGHAPDEVLGAAARRICAALNFGEVGDDHE